MIAKTRETGVKCNRMLLTCVAGIALGNMMCKYSEIFLLLVPGVTTFQYKEDRKNDTAQVVSATIPPSLRPYQICPHQNHTSCSIQKDKPCSFRNFVHTISYVAGKISSVNASNMNFDQLVKFCTAGIPQMASYEELNSTVNANCQREMRNDISVIPIGPSEDPVVLLPGWGRYWPGVDSTSRSHWRAYSTGILVNDTVCFWPSIPKLHEAEKDLSLWTQGDNSLDMVDSPLHYKKVMISFGFFDNIWHAFLTLNTWCNMRDHDNLYFAIESRQDNAPSYIYDWGELMGISKERIITLRDQPIFVKEMLVVALQPYVDWACLHGALRLPFDSDTDSYAMLYTRNTGGLSRDIPSHISDDLEVELSKQIPDLKVKKFVGTEPLPELQRLFANAKVVIGPHGAGFVNIVFCQEHTPVVEFVTPALLNRPWQMYGGHSFQLRWWPVLLDSFDSRNQILDAVVVVKQALEDARTP